MLYGRILGNIQFGSWPYYLLFYDMNLTMHEFDNSLGCSVFCVAPENRCNPSANVW